MSDRPPRLRYSQPPGQTIRTVDGGAHPMRRMRGQFTTAAYAGGQTAACLVRDC